jgi:hypothetical protein
MLIVKKKNVINYPDTIQFIEEFLIASKALFTPVDSHSAGGFGEPQAPKALLGVRFDGISRHRGRITSEPFAKPPSLVVSGTLDFPRRRPSQRLIGI